MVYSFPVTYEGMWHIYLTPHSELELNISYILGLQFGK